MNDPHDSLNTANAKVVTLEERIHLEYDPASRQFVEARGRSPSNGAEALSSDRLRAVASQLASEVSRLGQPIQALFARQVLRRHVLAQPPGSREEWQDGVEDVMIRIETSRGAIVDSLGAPLARATPDIAPLVERVRRAVEALEFKERNAPTPTLPVLLPPSVVTQWLAAFAPLLRADIAAQTFGAHLGKKLFPSCVSLIDSPAHPHGTVLREKDEDGVEAEEFELVLQGKLQGFLHAGASSGAPGAFGRGVKQGAAIVPGWTNFFLAPSAWPLALPEDRLEVCARVETFSPRPRAGRVDLLVAGYEIRRGERSHAFGPIPLEGPALGFLRRVHSVGQDLTFFPTTEGCGAPSVLLASLTPGSSM